LEHLLCAVCGLTFKTSLMQQQHQFIWTRTVSISAEMPSTCLEYLTCRPSWFVVRWGGVGGRGEEVWGGAVNDVLKINCSKGISWKPRTSSPQLCKSLASLKTFCYLLEPFAGPGVRQQNFRQANGCAFQSANLHVTWEL
jgi:hypothetical protein